MSLINRELRILAPFFLCLFCESLRVTVQAVPGPEHCQIELTATNTGDRPLVLKFNTAQRFDFYAKDENDRIIWKWSNEMVFANVQDKVTVQSGESLRHKAKWNYVRNDGRRVKAGKYAIMGAVASKPQNRYSKTVSIEVPSGQ